MFKYFFIYRKKRDRSVVCWRLFVIFLRTGMTFTFFHSSRKIPLSKHDLKKISRSVHIDGPYTFDIWMLIPL